MSSLARRSHVVASFGDLQRRAVTCRQSAGSSCARRSSRHVGACVHAASSRFHRHSTLNRCCKESRGTKTQEREPSHRRKRGKEHNAPGRSKHISPLYCSRLLLGCPKMSMTFQNVLACSRRMQKLPDIVTSQA